MGLFSGVLETTGGALEGGAKGGLFGFLATAAAFAAAGAAVCFGVVAVVGAMAVWCGAHIAATAVAAKVVSGFAAMIAPWVATAGAVGGGSLGVMSGAASTVGVASASINGIAGGAKSAVNNIARGNGQQQMSDALREQVVLSQKLDTIESGIQQRRQEAANNIANYSRGDTRDNHLADQENRRVQPQAPGMLRN